MRIARAVLFAGVLAGCVALPPEPSGPAATASSRLPGVATPSATGSTPVVPFPTDVPPTEAPSTVTAPPIAADACLLKAQPGPADVAPTKGDLTDWSHMFGGRIRICLGGVQPAEFEATAICRWTEPFDAVSDVYGNPINVSADIGRIDGGVSLDRGVVSVGLTGPTGLVSSWEGAPPDQQIRSQDHGRRGIVRFDVSPNIDPEHPPAVVPQHVVGLMRWACLEPPPP